MPTGPPTRGDLSLPALAKVLGVSPATVQKAVATGRLARSLGRVKGRTVVVDLDLARQEWAEGATRPPNDGRRGPSLASAQIRVAIQRAAGLRLANRQKRGQLIDADVAGRKAFDCARTVRDSLLNIPARLSAELAAERDERRVFIRLDEEIRKALATLAEILAHGE